METNTINFVLQGRGGVGKSFSAALLAQYLMYRGVPVSCYDTDPVNDTFRQYEVFAAQRINILGSDNNINARAFDDLVASLLAENKIAVIDNGASTFVPMMAYLVENHVIEMLHDAGRRVLLHSVLTGGQALDDTRSGLKSLLETHDAPVVVWINEYFGPVQKDGVEFTESQLYERYQNRIHGVIRISRGNADTFGKDLELMLEKKLTFAEAIASERFGIMPRHRLKMIRDDIFQQLETGGI
jgi:hypothetical protein